MRVPAYCDQTVRRDRLNRQLEWMNPKTGVRRWLLDLFYDTGTRWTRDTVLGLLVIVPLRLMSVLFSGVGVILQVPAIGAAAVSAFLYDLGDDLARLPSDWAFHRYRKVLRDRDDIVASGQM